VVRPNERVTGLRIRVRKLLCGANKLAQH
jgi:hypothetical protein